MFIGGNSRAVKSQQAKIELLFSYLANFDKNEIEDGMDDCSLLWRVAVRLCLQRPRAHVSSGDDSEEHPPDLMRRYAVTSKKRQASETTYGNVNDD